MRPTNGPITNRITLWADNTPKHSHVQVSDNQTTDKNTFVLGNRLSGPSSHTGHPSPSIWRTDRGDTARCDAAILLRLTPPLTAAARTTCGTPASTGYQRLRPKSGTTTSSSQRRMSRWNASGAADAHLTASL